MKNDENDINSVDIMATSVILKSIKGDNLVQMHYRVMALSQNVALVMVNIYVKSIETNL